jgi:hypothetical protein
MSDIKVGDTIHHGAVPPGLLDVKVLEIRPCEGNDHPSYRINDPETREPDWVCSREFHKVA